MDYDRVLGLLIGAVIAMCATLLSIVFVLAIGWR
jgi:hypothetical protein